MVAIEIVKLGRVAFLDNLFYITNVLLEAGEANLPRQSIVVVSQVSTVEKARLGEYIGSLSQQRIHQVLAGMRFLQRLTEHGETGEESNEADEKRTGH